MGLWGEDPKDQTIALLRDEVEHLREVEKELRAQLLALTSSSAYRLVHNPAEPPPPGDVKKSPLEERHIPFKPDYTVESQMAKKPLPIQDMPLAEGAEES